MLISLPTVKIIWCYNAYKEKFSEFRDVFDFHEGIYDEKFFKV